MLAQTLFFRLYNNMEDATLKKPGKLLQTQDGGLWVGDKEGLWQFDGQEFKQVPSRDSLQSQAVSALYEDESGRLWVGFSHGGIYWLDSEQWLCPWETEEGWPAAAITDFAQDSSGALWWSAYGEGVYCQRGAHIYHYGQEDGLPALDIYALEADSQGRILAAHDKGLTYLYWEGQEKRCHNFTQTDGLPDDIIQHLLADAAGGYWIAGYEGGPAYFHLDSTATSRLDEQWEAGSITGIAQFDTGDLWVSTLEGQLLHWQEDIKKWEEHIIEGWLKPQIEQLFTDQEGNLWIVDKRYGLASANRRLLFLKQTPPSVQCVAVSQDEQTIWLGTAKGLWEKKATSADFYRILDGQAENFISIYQDPYGYLWLGTFGEYCLVYDPSTGKKRWFLAKQGLANGNIMSISGTEGKLYLATLGGVFSLEYNQHIFEDATASFKSLGQEPTQIGASFIYSSFIDSKGTLWLGTDGKGLSSVSKDQIYTHYDTEGGSQEVKSIYAITEDGAGKIWVSTAAGEVYYVQDNNLQPAPFMDYANFGSFISLGRDRQGRLLLAHSRGIDSWDAQSQQMLHLGDAVGLQSFDPVLNGITQGGKGSSYILGEGYLLLYEGLPKRFREVPTPHITQVAVLLEPVDRNKKGSFKAAKNSVSFNFTAAWFTDPDRVKFQYLLEGFDRDWISTEDQQAIYSNLPPGTYTFHLAASAIGRFDRSKTVSYHFTIRRPLWQQAWFLVLAAGLILGSLWYYWLVRERRVQREASLIREKIESQFQALKSQINPHFLFNSFNTLISLIEETPDKAVLYVEKMSDFYRSILQYRANTTVPISTELKMLEDYAYLLEQRYGSSFQLVINIPNRAYNIVPFSLQLLVENAVKHNVISINSPLQVRLYIDQGYLYVHNILQPKITQEESTGFGISSLKKQYQLLTDRPLLVKQTADYFLVGLPLIQIKNE